LARFKPAKVPYATKEVARWDAKAVVEELDQLRRKVPTVVAKALSAEAKIIMGVSVDRTPVDTTALRDSHITLDPTITGNDIEVKIEVGGPAGGEKELGYALAVHENLEARHDVASGFRGGQAKFLESAVNEAAPNLPTLLIQRIRDSLF